MTRRRNSRNEEMKERQRDNFGRFIEELGIRKCIVCGKEFKVKTRSRPCRYCSQKCYRSSKQYIDASGYICIKKPNHPHATTNGWVRQHIVVATQKLGRTLYKNEVVHHIDGNKLNNESNNIQVLKNSEHTRLHFGNPLNKKGNEPNIFIECACGCGNTFLKYDKRGRPRKYIAGHSGGQNCE